MELLMDKARANKAAGVVLEYIGTLDPTWAERIQITKDEFQYDDLQCVGAYVANQLDAGLHTVIPRHPFFEPGFVPPQDGHVCPVCKLDFKPLYPGQPVCSNQCAATFYKN
jgi:hypothetical protein